MCPYVHRSICAYVYLCADPIQADIALLRKQLKKKESEFPDFPEFPNAPS